MDSRMEEGGLDSYRVAQRASVRCFRLLGPLGPVLSAQSDCCFWGLGEGSGGGAVAMPHVVVEEARQRRVVP